MSQNTGTTVAAAIRVNDSLDPIASAFANEIKGGNHSYATILERNNLIIQRREWGMLVHVFADITSSNNGTYQLKKGKSSSDIMDNNNWDLFVASSTTNEWIDSVKTIVYTRPLSPLDKDRHLVGLKPSDNVGSWSPSIVTQTVLSGCVAQWDLSLSKWVISYPYNGYNVRVDNKTNEIYRYDGNFSSGQWVSEKLTQVVTLTATSSNGIAYNATVPTFSNFSKDVLYLVSFDMMNIGTQSTLNLNSITDLPLRKPSLNGLVNLDSKDIKTGSIYSLVYDGIGFQVNLPNTGMGFDNKYFIAPDERIVVPEYYQYWIYGNLTVEGELINYGQVVIGDGNMIVQNGGTFSNFGSLDIVDFNLGGSGASYSFIDTSTIDLTNISGTVSANVIASSLTPSHINVINSPGVDSALVYNNGNFEYKSIRRPRSYRDVLPMVMSATDSCVYTIHDSYDSTDVEQITGKNAWGVKLRYFDSYEDEIANNASYVKPIWGSSYNANTNFLMLSTASTIDYKLNHSALITYVDFSGVETFIIGSGLSSDINNLVTGTSSELYISSYTSIYDSDSNTMGEIKVIGDNGEFIVGSSDAVISYTSHLQTDGKLLSYVYGGNNYYFRRYNNDLSIPNSVFVPSGGYGYDVLTLTSSHIVLLHDNPLKLSVYDSNLGLTYSQLLNTLTGESYDSTRIKMQRQSDNSLIFAVANSNSGTITKHIFSIDVDLGGVTFSYNSTFEANLPTNIKGNYVNDIKVLSDDSILLFGCDVDDRVFKLDATGITYSGFSSTITNVIAGDVQSSGNIILAGTFSGVVQRLTATGSILPILDSYIYPSVGDIKRVHIDNMDRIYLYGSFTDFNNIGFNRLVRLESNGSMDTMTYDKFFKSGAYYGKENSYNSMFQLLEYDINYDYIWFKVSDSLIDIPDHFSFEMKMVELPGGLKSRPSS